MGSIRIEATRPPWVVARWAFAGYLEHVLAEVRNDAALAHAVEQAMALDGLHLTLVDRDVAERLGPVLLRVADEVIAGTRTARVEGRELDARSQEQFRRAVGELRPLLGARFCS